MKRNTAKYSTILLLTVNAELIYQSFLTFSISFPCQSRQLSGAHPKVFVYLKTKKRFSSRALGSPCYPECLKHFYESSVF